MDPDGCAILSDVPLLHREPINLSGTQLRHIVQILQQVIWMSNVLECLRLHFFLGIAGDVTVDTHGLTPRGT